MATWKDITPPPSPMKKPPKLDDPDKLLIKRGEKHKEKFEDDAEKRAEARGYMVIMACNLTSCWALSMCARSRVATPC